jgi:hypothetical protein
MNVKFVSPVYCHVSRFIPPDRYGGEQQTYDQIVSILFE